MPLSVIQGGKPNIAPMTEQSADFVGLVAVVDMELGQLDPANLTLVSLTLGHLGDLGRAQIVSRAQLPTSFLLSRIVSRARSPLFRTSAGSAVRMTPELTASLAMKRLKRLPQLADRTHFAQQKSPIS
nr:hypothetical protein [Novosphingobium resinovorum]